MGTRLVKYMGSKQSLLANGLGELVVAQSRSVARVIDLFSGAGAITWHAAEHAPLPVLAVDLQHYSKALAEAVILRTSAVAPGVVEDEWLGPAGRRLHRSKLWRMASGMSRRGLTGATVRTAREVCEEPSSIGPIWNAYGGFYYSPAQAIAFDYLRATVPEDHVLRSLCIGVLVIAASRCAASPGHTAQPFRPTDTALRYIEASWGRSPFDVIRKVLPDVARRAAMMPGRAVVGDALGVAATTSERDLVIVDPPYSAAQYSRFYHVLETVARGECGPVQGAGRYPPMEERPQSDYSKRSTAHRAVHDLLRTLGERGARVIVTFPQVGASNGIDGEELIGIASEWYLVDVTVTNSRFSTLGGNGRDRSSRRQGVELVLSLSPRTKRR